MVSGWGVDDIWTMEMLEAESAQISNPPRYARMSQMVPGGRNLLNSGNRTISLTGIDATPIVPEGYSNDSSFTAITYTLTNADNWKHTFDEQPKYDADGNSYYYYVVETTHTPDDYYIASYSGDPLNTSGTITITNKKDEPQTGNLLVSKTVNSNGSLTENITNKDFSFTVKLSDKSISGNYGEMTFINGDATFTLKHNETKTATGLPAGVTYTVEEASVDGYTPSYSVSTDTIPAGNTAIVLSSFPSNFIINHHTSRCLIALVSLSKHQLQYYSQLAYIKKYLTPLH